MTTSTHESVLKTAYEKALASYQKKPTVENLKNMTAAEKALADYRARNAEPGERRFKTIDPDVLNYLKGEGWKVAKSKLYADKNKIEQEKDGTYTKKAVDDYARLCLSKIDGSDTEYVDAAVKNKVEIEIAREKLEKLKREREIEEGLWVLQSEVEQKHTAKLALLLAAVDNFIYGGKMEEAIEIVNGDKALAAELKEFMKKSFRAALGEYAKRPEFTVPKRSMAEAEEFKKEENL